MCIRDSLEIVDRLMHELCLPIIKAKRPVWDTFPGAWYTIGIDAIMPNGRTLQVASCHHYKDQWAKAFDITYENIDAEQSYVHQTTYGMSERLLGAIVGMHGDDHGLIMPPSIAPIQVVICPMVKKNSDVDTISVSQEIATTLRNAGYRVHVDDRDLHPGQKYYDWEIKGVPLRLDIGPRDIAQNTVFSAKRTGGKQPLAMDDISRLVQTCLDEVSQELRHRSAQHMKDVVQHLPKIIHIDSEWKLEQPIVDGKIYELAFCGSDAHAEIIERVTCLLYTSPSPRDATLSRMPSSA